MNKPLPNDGIVSVLISLSLAQMRGVTTKERTAIIEARCKAAEATLGNYIKEKLDERDQDEDL